MVMSRVLTEKELAEVLGLSQWTIRTLRLQKGLPHFGTAGRIFYRLESVLRWMDAQEAGANQVHEQFGVIRTVR